LIIETSQENTQEQEKIKTELITEASLDSKMKNITNEIEALKEKEIKRLTDTFLENNNIDKDYVQALTKIFECLFGEKETIRLMSSILTEKKEMKQEIQKIVKNSRSMSDPNSIQNGIYQMQIEQNIKNLEARKDLVNKYSMKGIFSGFDDVNFKYNFLYNKVPSLQNRFPDSTFLKFKLKK